jgi:hypothetical protein
LSSLTVRRLTASLPVVVWVVSNHVTRALIAKAMGTQGGLVREIRDSGVLFDRLTQLAIDGVAATEQLFISALSSELEEEMVGLGVACVRLEPDPGLL